MPGMPRLKGKPTKIAYALLGVPLNMQKDKKKNKQVERKLQFDETSRVR
jgi:hypothetical protein